MLVWLVYYKGVLKWVIKNIYSKFIVYDFILVFFVDMKKFKNRWLVI